MLKQGVYLLPESLFQPSDLDFCFLGNNPGFDKYLFILIILSKPDFSC